MSDDKPSPKLDPNLAAMTGLVAAGAIAFRAGYASGRGPDSLEEQAERNWPAPPSSEPTTRVETEIVHCCREGCEKQTAIEFVEVVCNDSGVFEGTTLLSDASPGWIIGINPNIDKWGDEHSVEISDELCFCSTACILEHARKKDSELAAKRSRLRESFIAESRLKRAIEERGRLALVAEFGEDLLSAVREGKIR